MAGLLIVVRESSVALYVKNSQSKHEFLAAFDELPWGRRGPQNLRDGLPVDVWQPAWVDGERTNSFALSLSRVEVSA
jgi:hypothetical protein